MTHSNATIHVFRDSTTTAKEIRICVKPTASKQVSLQAFALGGASELQDPRDDVAFCLAGDILRESGLLTLSGSELARLEASTGTRVFLQRHLHHRGIGGSCPRHELNLLLDMVVARLKYDPEISETVVERLKHREKQSIEAIAARSAASTAGTDETSVIRELAFGDEEDLLKAHKMEHVAELDSERVRQIVRRAFGRPEESTFCLIGGGLEEDADSRIPQLLENFARRLLANEDDAVGTSALPRWCRVEGELRRMNLKFRSTKDRIKVVNVGRTITDKSQAFIVFKPQDSRSLRDIPETDFLLNALCEILRSRLIARLRTDRGEVYSVSADYSRVALSPFTRLFVSFSCSMHSDSDIIRRAQEEIEQMAVGDFTGQEISNVLATLRSQKERATTDSHLLFRLMDGLKMAQGDFQVADEIASQRMVCSYLEDEKHFQASLKRLLQGAVSNGMACLVIRHCPLEKL